MEPATARLKIPELLVLKGGDLPSYDAAIMEWQDAERAHRGAYRDYRFARLLPWEMANAKEKLTRATTELDLAKAKLVAARRRYAEERAAYSDLDFHAVLGDLELLELTALQRTCTLGEAEEILRGVTIFTRIAWFFGFNVKVPERPLPRSDDHDEDQKARKEIFQNSEGFKQDAEEVHRGMYQLRKVKELAEKTGMALTTEAQARLALLLSQEGKTQFRELGKVLFGQEAEKLLPAGEAAPKSAWQEKFERLSERLASVRNNPHLSPEDKQRCEEVFQRQLHDHINSKSTEDE